MVKLLRANIRALVLFLLFLFFFISFISHRFRRHDLKLVPRCLYVSVTDAVFVLACARLGPLCLSAMCRLAAVVQMFLAWRPFVE